jgi:serralysin
VTGQSVVNLDSLTFNYAQTPAVHDIYTVQQIYGADTTTRSGNTVYGFNSTADKDVFDFTQNTNPLLTIWDGGGTDTLDLSGFNSNSIIDLNDGAFSSAGYKVTDAVKAQDWAWLGITNETQWQNFLAKYGVNPDGSPHDNIAIAYGAIIENAVGGSGNDTMTGNEFDNVLRGNRGNDSIDGGAGNDTASYQAATKAVLVDLSKHSASGGDGNDTLVSIENFIGSGSNDTLIGDAGSNRLDGGAGNDKINGGSGDDFIVGGLGNDDLTGGAGADTFVFGEMSNDTIRDFQTGLDKIDLSTFQIDATAIKIDGNNLFADTNHDSVYDFHVTVLGSAVHTADVLFA